MGWLARWVGFPVGQRTSGGVAVADGVGVAVAERSGEASLGLTVAAGLGSLTTDRKLPTRMTTATTALTATASTAMIKASRRLGAGRPGGPLLARSPGAGLPAGLSAGPVPRGSSVITVDHWEPSQ